MLYCIRYRPKKQEKKNQQYISLGLYKIQGGGFSTIEGENPPKKGKKVTFGCRDKIKKWLHISSHQKNINQAPTLEFCTTLD